jgi:hypothetical protein
MRTLNYLPELLLFALFCFAQPIPVNAQPSGTLTTIVPPCTLNFALDRTGPSAQFANSVPSCDKWTLTVYNVGFSGFTLTFQSAPAATFSTPGSFSTYGGTTATGSNPLTATGIATFTNGTVATPWLRVNLTGLSGSGIIYGVLQGTQSLIDSSGGGGGGGGCTSPCPVEGTAAAGAPPVGPPVLIGGSDGTDVRTIKTDSAGALIISGTTLTSCDPSVTSTVPITLTSGAGGVTLLVAASAGKTITVCHISLSFAVGQNFNLQQGTGSTCAGSTALATGVYQSISGIALDVPFDITVSNGLCALGSNATDAGGGLLVYVQK